LNQALRKSGDVKRPPAQNARQCWASIANQWQYELRLVMSNVALNELIASPSVWSFNGIIPRHELRPASEKKLQPRFSVFPCNAQPGNHATLAS